MAFTTRLPEVLQSEADAYASSLGISLNALVAIALRDYLNARSPDALASALAIRDSARPPAENKSRLKVSGVMPSGLPKVVSARSAPAPQKIAPQVLEPGEAIPRKVSRSPCWCGSGKELRRCHQRLKQPSD